MKKVAILDMQPIDPPVGGGRLRLLGLYHALGCGMRATYVGTYDWPGPDFRQHMLSDSLEEIDVPLSEAHFRAAKEAARNAGGRGVIDCVFHYQGHLSPEYVAQARRCAWHADIVVFSHPWIYPLVREVLDHTRQLIVYDSHNVEGLLRTKLLDDGAGGTEVARGVVEVEHELCHAADLILACSHQDRLHFERLYGVPIERINVVPNGVFCDTIRPADAALKTGARQRCGLGAEPVALFLGSSYGPNVEAARFIAGEVAPRMPAVQFVIAGGVSDGLKDMELPANCRLTGAIGEATKMDLLAGATIAINPMFSGSGTNIKMFDFMAAGLPTLTTPVGGRGIETGTEAFVTATRGAFVQQLSALVADESRRNALAIAARHEAERHYAWEQISPALGGLLHRRHAKKASGLPRPYFSVVVPTFERADSLRRLLDRLAVQKEDSFEVIVVDQSAEAWPGANLQFAFDLLYVRSDIRGAVCARNLGASLARGDVIAFIDDDCEPASQWLEQARIIFSQPDVVGIEGLIKSDRLGDPEWRSVTNEGFSGLGFMTANLLVRRTAFQRLNGFDIAFEEPNFREDTDFGWRLQQLGRVPFSDTAWVFHPPHRRSIDRESLPERLALFQKDALLIKKHPDRYRELFFAEAHFKRTPGFARQLLIGAEKHGVELPDYILERLPNERTIPQRERA